MGILSNLIRLGNAVQRGSLMRDPNITENSKFIKRWEVNYFASPGKVITKFRVTRVPKEGSRLIE